MGKFRAILGIEELKTTKNCLWKALLAEFIGNLILNFFGCGSVVATQVSGVASPVLIALTFGFTIFILVQALGHVSGAHLNPAVTAGMLFTGNTPVIKGLLYVVVQCLGALSGSAILKALSPEDLHDKGLGITLINEKFTIFQGLGMEFFLGFILVLTVFGVCDENRPEMKSTAPLAIGLAVGVGHLATVGITGASMNPARTFGAAVISGTWTNHWVYWVGPIIGGVAAGLLYQNAFKAPNVGPLRIVERYLNTTVVTDEKELRRLDGNKVDDNLA